MGKYLLPFMLLLCLHVHAQDSLQVNPDRPDVTNGTGTILPGYLQLEHGSFFQKEKEDGLTVNTYGIQDLSMRMGIVKNLEINFHYLLAHQHQDDFNTSYTGIAAASAGFKYSMGEQHGILPSFSVAGGISLPGLISNALNDQRTTYSTALLFQHELKGWEIGYNFLFSKAASTPAQWGYSVSVRKDVTEKLSGFIENYLFLQDEKADVSFDAGLGYSINNLLMLDMAAATTVNRNLHYFTVGFSYLIPKKLL